MKKRAAEEVGITVHHLKIPKEVTESEVVSTIEGLNRDESVHAILLQLPLDSVNDIDAEKCTNIIAVEKVRERLSFRCRFQLIVTTGRGER